MWIEREFSFESILKDTALAIILFFVLWIYKNGFIINEKIIPLFIIYVFVLFTGLSIRSYVLDRYRSPGDNGDGKNEE